MLSAARRSRVRFGHAAAEPAAPDGRGRGLIREAPAQPKGEFRARKVKKNQGKILAFPWISLAESGLFNGLWRIQIKNLGLVSTRLSGCAPTRQTDIQLD